MNHDFKVIPLTKHLNRQGKEVQRWHCKPCDTIVEYPVAYNAHDVNQRLMEGHLKCMPPLDYGNQMADQSYHDKKYEIGKKVD